MKKLCFVATIPAVVHAFLREHIQTAAKNYQVTVICNTSEQHLLEGLNARLILLPIERKPSPLRDLWIMLTLLKLFRREQFDIVHSIMPKTGLLAMFSAYIARVPIRIHTFTGQVWATKKGVPRILLKWLDKLIAYFSVCILADSPSQRDFLLNEKVLSRGKIKVLGAGSICGVNPQRFHPDIELSQRVRQELGIAQGARLILYVGRLNRDKGVIDLAASFNMLAQQYSNVELLLVGAEEAIHFSDLQNICSAFRERLHYVSFTATPEYYMAAADIFCLPSYREGFGLTIIEAAACGVPAVASRIYGITDAVEDGLTGILFPAGDVDLLTEALSSLIDENETLQLMGKAAQTRVLAFFSSEEISQELLILYDQMVIEMSTPA